MVLLDTRNRLIAIETVYVGSLNLSLVRVGELFKAAIQRNAASLILAHNHPSGDPTPSDADIRMTRDLIRAGQLLKIQVIDHVILGYRTVERPRDFSSLRELGFFYD